MAMSSPAIRIRNARGELVEPAKISSSDAKNRFGKILERVTEEGGVAITLRNEPKFVVISIEAYQRLARADARSLNALTDEFDALLDRMQEPGARAAMARAFDMTPEELGQAARRHGGVAASQRVATGTASRARKGKALPSGVTVTKVVGRAPQVKRVREVKKAILKGRAAKKTKHRTRG
ncbi:MAG: type II toxin-antitoxin system prevent-host-death family antitoxin [Burkholderiales bacterium]|nr:type II toxin-antitoxin system prevent-host-death family antitoxin [Burkholderiales bacterium]